MIDKKGVINLPVIILSSLGVLVLILGGSFVYLSMNGTDYSDIYSQRALSGEIKNPITELGLNYENITGEFRENETLNSSIQLDESLEKELIKYVAINLKLYNLHKIPFTSITPKIKVNVDNRTYFVEIERGEIFVDAKDEDGEDLRVNTNSEEIKKMLKDVDYVSESFGSGNTYVELTGNKLELFSKGYLALYNEWSEELDLPFEFEI